MTMIYRRNRGLSPSRRDEDTSRDEKQDATLLGGAKRWWRKRFFVFNGLASHRVYQTMWLAVLVYAFLGLPVLGRILNFVRYVHRFTFGNMVKGLVVGLLQDIAIFMQASTLICVVKLVFHRNSTGLTNSYYPRSNGLLRGDSATGRMLRLPVYMPVLTNEYDIRSGNGNSNGGDEQQKHLTLLASSSVAPPSSSPLYFSSSLASSSTVSGRWSAWLSRICQHFLVIVLLKVILVLATIASVADFCLQVTMHPRLNRAFVEIFVNYASQFTASLMDEEVLTRTVVCSWTIYFALICILTYGFFAGKLPLLPDFFYLPSIFCCCDNRWGHARKNSMASSTTSSAAAATSTTSTALSGPKAYVSSLFSSYWLGRKAQQQRVRRRSSHNYSHATGMYYPQPASSSSSLSLPSFASCYNGNKQPGPAGIISRCIVASAAMSLFALTASLIVDHHGVDMKMMANAMFSLQTEEFFPAGNPFRREEINCTLASNELLATLSPTEVYDLHGLGNDDKCALLWRKTIGFRGENIFELEWNHTASSTVAIHKEEIKKETDKKAAPKNESAITEDTVTVPEETVPPKVLPPNIIVINMESWRAMDVGVLGGAAKKQKYGKSATPNFDELSKSGILYKKHYTQCVQTTRTLLTTLFGMLPSCTETTALKRYGTSLNVRGLPQFLKKRGYFNMFWSAVDLTWEYWDKFLLQNGFDKIVDDRKVRKMLHETRDYKNQPDDHFSWGMHDHLSFEMLLYAIESAHNATILAKEQEVAMNANASVTDGDLVNNTSALELNGTITSDDNVWRLPPSTSAAAATVTSEKEPNGGEKSSTASDQQQRPALSKQLNGWEGLEAPYFIDMYTITSHNPWALPHFYKVPDLSKLYTLYNKKYLDSVYFSDEMLGDFIAALREKDLMKNTIVIIEGDHGYGRMEHDNNPSIADSGLYEEATHVPFLILADDFLSEKEKGMVVDQLTMQSDLMATIADILGVSPEEPLYQHGYGHSMKRKRPTSQQALDDGENAVSPPIDVALTITKEAAIDPADRRVLLCNPFNGMSKGVRTEKFKYIFFPDGSFKIFEPEKDPEEKNPIRIGFDVQEMDDATRIMYDYVNEHVDLNQFLYESDKFTTALPQPTPHIETWRPVATRNFHRLRGNGTTTTRSTSEKAIPVQKPPSPPV